MAERVLLLLGSAYPVGEGWDVWEDDETEVVPEPTEGSLLLDVMMVLADDCTDCAVRDDPASKNASRADSARRERMARRVDLKTVGSTDLGSSAINCSLTLSFPDKTNFTSNGAPGRTNCCTTDVKCFRAERGTELDDDALDEEDRFSPDPNIASNRLISNKNSKARCSR